MSKKSKNRASGSSIARATNVQQSSSGEFNPDYSYVKKDLRRIASLAVFFFVVLIAISFVLR